MSRTERGHKPPDYEFWSRRPYYGEGKEGKRMTHQQERHNAKEEIKAATRAMTACNHNCGNAAPSGGVGNYCDSCYDDRCLVPGPNNDGICGIAYEAQQEPCEWELEEGGYYDGLSEADLDWLQGCIIHGGSYQGDGERCTEVTA